MSSKNGAIRAGKAFVELFADDSALQRTLSRVGGRLKSWGASLAKVGGVMTGFGASALTAFVPTIKAASDLQETMSKFGVVFGSSAGAMKAWGDALAAQIGRSKGEVASFLANTQDLLVPIGLDPAAAEELSKTIVKLTYDLGSFNNMADADVMRDLHAALTGSGEVMKKYGVVVSEAAVKSELLSTAIDPRAATEAQKAFARLSIILRGTSAAHGDAARTADGFANTFKRLQSVASDTMAEIGSAILPAVTRFTSALAGVVQSVGAMAAANPAVVQSFAAIAVGVTAAGVALVTVGGGMAALGSIVSGISAGVGLLASGLAWIITPVGALTAAAAALAAGFVYLSAKAMDWAGALSTVKGAWGGIVAAVQAGDLQGACDIAFQSIKVAWMQLTLAMREGWKATIDNIAQGIASVPGVAAALGVDKDALKESLAENQANTGPVLELESERSKLRQMLAAVKSHPANLPDGGLPFADTTAPPPVVAAAAGMGDGQRRQEGTMSGMSDRMFGGGYNRVNDRWQTLTEIAEATRKTADRIDKLSKNGMVYTRG